MRETPSETIDRSDRQGSIALVVLLAVGLVGASLATYWLDDHPRSLFLLWFLALLAAIGLVAMLMYAVGILQLSARAVRNDLTKRIADTAGEGLLVVDGDAKIIYANSAYLAMAGTDAGEPKLVERVFAGSSDVTEAVYRLAKAAREGRSVSEEMRMAPALGNSGDVGWYKVRVRPLERNGEKLSVWTVSDRTRDREKQENVFQELQHAIDYLDHAPAGFLSAAADGSIAYINATLAGWLDLDLAQVGSGGLKLSDIVVGDGAALLAGTNGAPGTVETETIDIDLKRPSGRTLPARLFHSVAFAADGTRGLSRTLVLNRSPGAETAEGLRAAEVRFARFFNSTPLAIAMVDAKGRITRANAPFARAFPSEVSISGGGRQIVNSVHERERPALQAALDAAVQGRGDIQPLDLELSGDGNRSARFFISSVEEEGESEDDSAIVYALETTEQQKLQEQFFQAQKMNAIGQLAGGVAHDFNNHLQSILGFADLLLSNHKPTDASFADIVQIKNSANRAKSLVRQLLAFSRQQTLTPEEIHVGERLSELSNMLKRSIGPKVDLDVRYARDLWPVHADPASFDNMIINLAVNARDAMPNGGKLTVRTKNVSAADTRAYESDQLKPGEYALIEVEDTGTGIAPEIVEKIFEPFFTTKEIGRGTGLGLSSAYGFVQQSGGVILCDSTVGKGTTFRIFLPRYQRKAGDVPQTVAVGHGTAARIETAPAKPAPAAADLTGQGTILLVEDEEAVRNFAARALASRGYTVLQAPSGLEGLEIAKGRINDIDLVVSDVVMPEMDGPTMLGELRKLNPDLKVIFVSGYAEEAFRKNLPEGQQFNFLPKPFSLKQLVETVKTVLAE